VRDLVIVGGGPAGLAAAIAAARQGLSVTVLERRHFPVDKACGEGILPGGVAHLAELGVTLEPSFVLEGIRYLQEDGTSAHAPLPPPHGLGVRRTVLSRVLYERARALGAEVRQHSPELRYQIEPDQVRVEYAGGIIDAQLLIAADGLHSPIRHAAGLDRPSFRRKRFGVRRHFTCAPWSHEVEVHFARGVEAYVTPVAADCVGVALLSERDIRFDLAAFPALRQRLGETPPASEIRGRGPLAQGSRARTADRLVLIGDAAGYVDAITGEGLSLAFTCALGLADILPAALAQGATRASLAAYERLYARAFRRYAWWARSLVEIAAHPAARRRIVRSLARHPRTFARLTRWAVG
jgi:flavin-dependent dehydrogenase